MSWLSLCADEISEVLQGTGLKQAEIARKYQVSPSNITSVVKHNRNPKMERTVSAWYRFLADFTFCMMYDIDWDKVVELAEGKGILQQIPDMKPSRTTTKSIGYERADAIAGMLGVSVWDITKVVKRSDYDY